MLCRAFLAQSAARQSHNLKVLSSILREGKQACEGVAFYPIWIFSAADKICSTPDWIGAQQSKRAADASGILTTRGSSFPGKGYGLTVELSCAAAKTVQTLGLLRRGRASGLYGLLPSKTKVENVGVDPTASRMQSERSTI